VTIAEPVSNRAPGKPWALTEAAEFLGVSAKTLSRLAEAGKLRLLRLGTGRGRVLIPDAEVKRVAEGR
jgi:excisionase family DNA binding protein